MPRRTKIIATLGPATDDINILEKLILAGTNVVRLNFSHGSADEHVQRAKWVREIAAKHNIEIGILADLQGPKIRLAQFKEKRIQLTQGATFCLNAELDKQAGNINEVGIDYHDLPNDVQPNDILLLDDGRVVLKVKNVVGAKIETRVEIGGELSSNKGINRLGGGLSADALTTKDKQDIKTAVQLGADFIAVSFPRSATDIAEAQALVKKAGGSCGIVAKIERKEAIDNIETIIQASDAVMVARGDLGVEIGDAELPAQQKHIIHRCRVLDKAVIVATQMMESMIHNAIPTRAEVFDVANAVLDGTDAVMLSAETAAGENPEKVVSAMARICLGAEKQQITRESKHRLECRFQRVDEAIAMATMYTANHLDIKCIVALTESGSTPLWMSRIRSGIPIFALSRSVQTRRRMTLVRGVYPINFDVTQYDYNAINRQAIKTMEQHHAVEAGDLVIITKGDVMGVHGGANSMKIVKAGAVV
ncbi:MAG: pyruvate kinase [Pseudomonadota bacterium]